MWSSRYCSTFVHLFFLYFWVIVVFLGFFTSQKKSSTHRKYKLKQVKGIACGKFRSRAQNWQKACDHKKRILWPLFDQFKNLLPRQFFSDRFAYMERQKQSSYAKTRLVLRIGSELEDKTGTMCAKLVTAAKIRWKRWGKTHELDSNMT